MALRTHLVRLEELRLIDDDLYDEGIVDEPVNILQGVNRAERLRVLDVVNIPCIHLADLCRLVGQGGLPVLEDLLIEGAAFGQGDVLAAFAHDPNPPHLHVLHLNVKAASDLQPLCHQAFSLVKDLKLRYTPPTASTTTTGTGGGGEEAGPDHLSQVINAINQGTLHHLHSLSLLGYEGMIGADTITHFLATIKTGACPNLHYLMIQVRD